MSQHYDDHPHVFPETRNPGELLVATITMLIALAPGIPGEELTAVMLAVFYVHDVIPAAQLFAQQLDFIYALYISLFLLHVIVVVFLFFSTGTLMRVMEILNRFLGVMIRTLGLIGVYTIADSPLIAAERMAAEIQFILWAGGLYGLNPLCKSSLSQAAGAVLGAAKAVEQPTFDRPVIGMTSLGSSCLTYMKRLHPELTRRGYDITVFHATGMGGVAFERLAAEAALACVMDFSLQEFINAQHGSVVSGRSKRNSANGGTGCGGYSGSCGLAGDS